MHKNAKILLKDQKNFGLEPKRARARARNRQKREKFEKYKIKTEILEYVKIYGLYSKFQSQNGQKL